MPVTKIIGWSMSNDVSLLGIVSYRVCTTIGLKRTPRTARESFDTCFVNYLLKDLSSKNIKITIFCYVSHKKLFVSHFGKHSGFIGRVYVSVIIIHRSTYTSTRGRLKINKSGRERS